jgi:hypothetical protein
MLFLLALGERFDALAAQIDHAIEHGLDITWETLEQFGCINAAIVATPATTMQGLYVKARAGCWDLLGDFDSAGPIRQRRTNGLLNDARSNTTACPSSRQSGCAAEVS